MASPSFRIKPVAGRERKNPANGFLSCLPDSYLEGLAPEIIVWGSTVSRSIGCMKKAQS